MDKNPTIQTKTSKCRRLWCVKCRRGLGYPTPNRIKRYGSEKKLQDNYLCIKCRRSINYGKYLKEVREKPEVVQ